jgi:hypothetical protein
MAGGPTSARTVTTLDSIGHTGWHFLGFFVRVGLCALLAAQRAPYV